MSERVTAKEFIEDEIDSKRVFPKITPDYDEWRTIRKVSPEDVGLPSERFGLPEGVQGIIKTKHKIDPKSESIISIVEVEKRFHTINALKLDDETLHRLSIARKLRLLDENENVEALVDGGAQNIISFGREESEKLHPNGLNYNLMPEDVNFANEVIMNPEIDQYLPERFK